MDTLEKRHHIDAKLQTALELLEKAQAMVSIAWDERSAAANIAYCGVMAETARDATQDASTACDCLYRAIREEEERAEGTQRHTS